MGKLSENTQANIEFSQKLYQFLEQIESFLKENSGGAVLLKT